MYMQIAPLSLFIVANNKLSISLMLSGFLMVIVVIIAEI